MIDIFAHFCLSFSHAMVIIPLLLLGWIIIDRMIFYHALCLLFMSIIINFALKSTFQIPLSPNIGKSGFAFPSGHMQSAAVLYLWLALHFKNPIFRVLIIMLLMGISFSLYHFGYHNYFDIMGAVVVAIGLVFLYYFIFLKNSKILSRVLLITASSVMIYIYIHHGLIPLYVSRGYCILLAALAFEKMIQTVKLKKFKKPRNTLCI